MKIADGLTEAFARYKPGGHLLIAAGSSLFIWYDGEWHLRPMHGLVGSAVLREDILAHLKEYGGHIAVDRPPVRESEKSDPGAWRSVYLAQVKTGGETCAVVLSKGW